MILEYITNIYILPLISTIIGLAIVYLYDKFEKKQYTSALYLRIGVLIYISTYGALYISKLNCLSYVGNQQGGGNIGDTTILPQGNELNSHFDKFKIGLPSF
jgi:hypothetical protein